MITKQSEPRDRLTSELVVTTAIALADAEGLDALTIRRLSLDLGFTPMALYRHFRDKDELLDGMAARLLADVPVAVSPSTSPTDREGDASEAGLAYVLTWDEQLRLECGALLDSLRPHPNVAGLIVTRILASLAGQELSERVLSLLVRGGASNDQAAQIGSYVLNSLVMLVTTEPGAEQYPSQQDRDEAVRAKKATLLTLDPLRFPQLISSADALTSCQNDAAYYELGLEIVIAGIKGVLPHSGH